MSVYSPGQMTVDDGGARSTWDWVRRTWFCGGSGPSAP